eukprot:5040863-Pleurochrysis_carterae.AAC.1
MRCMLPVSPVFNRFVPQEGGRKCARDGARECERARTRAWLSMREGVHAGVRVDVRKLSREFEPDY